LKVFLEPAIAERNPPKIKPNSGWCSQHALGFRLKIRQAGKFIAVPSKVLPSALNIGEVPFVWEFTTIHAS